MQNLISSSTPLVEKLKGVVGFFGIRTADEPEYILKESDGNHEVRAYLPYTVASIEMNESFEDASDELVDYIFGKNSTKTEMPMTFPVMHENKGAKKSVCFVLPEGITTKNAPIPNNLNVRIESRPAEVVASIEYTGVNTVERMYEKEQELIKWIHAETSFIIDGEPRLAEYDQSISLPFLRRNEIQIPIRAN